MNTPRVLRRIIAPASALLLAATLRAFAQSPPLVQDASEAMQEALNRSIAEALEVPRLEFAADDQTQGKPPSQTQAPPTNPGPPSLGDLGFPASQTQPNPQEQARLNKRTHMLKIHQRLGLITTGPLVATVILGGLAGGRSTSSTTRDLHAALGATTAGLYLTTAYFSIFAPKIPGSRGDGGGVRAGDFVGVGKILRRSL